MSEKPDKSRRRALSSGWWLASLVFHALVLSWLFFFSPVRVIDLSANTPDTDSVRTARVMEQVRGQQASKLAGEVRALEETRRELAALESGSRDALRKSAPEAPVSIEKIAAAQEAATKAQAEADA